MLVFIVITTYSILAVLKSPYKENSNNELDTASTNVCSITVFLGAFMNQI